MPTFAYSAVDTNGATVRGDVAAPNEVEALESLARQGLTPVDIWSGSDHALKWWQREVSLGGPSAARPQDMLPAFTALAMFTQARMPLMSALDHVAHQVRNKTLKAEFAYLRDELEGGRSLKEAFDDRESRLPDPIVRLLVLGEASNQVGDVANQIVDLLKSEIEIRTEIRSALVYPIILLVMSVLVLCMLIFFLVPTLLPVFQTAGAEPPFILSTFNAVRVLILESGGVVLAVGFGFIASVLVFRNRFAGLVRRISTRLPVFGSFMRKKASLALCQNLALLMRSGMSVLDGIDIVISSLTHPAWRTATEDARDRIEAGEPLPDALDDLPFLDDATKSLIRVGDQTDRLPEMLQASIQNLRSETRDTLKRAVSLLTPLLTLLIGGIIGFLIVSTVTAILDLNDIVV